MEPVENIFWKVYVPHTHDGEKGWFFKLVCPGYAMSVSHERLLLLENAKVNRNLGFDNICNEKRVRIAYNNHPQLFVLNSKSGEMVNIPDFPGQPFPSVGLSTGVAKEWQIQALFFKTNNVTPDWINCNFTWGTLDETTGQWNGAVGVIQRDEADYSIAGFVSTYGRSRVAGFSSATRLYKTYWLTRYPLELSPLWNLMGLFTKGLRSQKSILNRLIRFQRRI